jgi:hypothetical protein
MKNIDLNNLLNSVRSRGAHLEEFDCRTYLAAKDLLEQDPTNEPAKKVIRNFIERMGGKDIGRTFFAFLIPFELTETEEERA